MERAAPHLPFIADTDFKCHRDLGRILHDDAFKGEEVSIRSYAAPNDNRAIESGKNHCFNAPESGVFLECGRNLSDILFCKDKIERLQVLVRIPQTGSYQHESGNERG
ncbi:MAG: hypothetical protein RL514_2227 [Verrucomicrobiota bacterium]